MIISLAGLDRPVIRRRLGRAFALCLLLSAIAGYAQPGISYSAGQNAHSSARTKHAIGSTSTLLLSSNLAAPLGAAPAAAPTAGGGVAQVQHASIDAGTLTSAKLSFNSSNTAGNWIAVFVRAGNSSSQLFTITDSNGNSYHSAFQLGLTASPLTFALFYAENIKGGANTVTVSDTVSGPLRFAIFEYSGIALTNSLDASAAGQGTGTSPTSGNAVTSAIGDLLLGNVVTTNAAAFTAGSGYTLESTVPVEPNTKLIAEDQIQITSGTASATASLAASDNWGAGLAAFKSATGGTGSGATISNLSPTSGPVGTPVTITGSNFGSTQGSSTVSFNGTAGTPTSWSSTSITVPVPTGATTGNVVVTVGGVSSAGVNFTVGSPAPTITRLNPTSGPVGTPVTITGTNFGSTQGSSTVSFNGTGGTPTSWSSTSIAVSVPTGATTGNVVVTVGGVGSAGVNFTVGSPAPTITSLNPTSGLVGTSVTITGTNFGSTQGTSTVSFNGTATAPTSWSSTSVVAPVPSGATTGNVVVTVGGVASNGMNFSVTSPTNGIALVQRGALDAGTTTSGRLAFASNNTAGNWIAVCVRGGSSSSQVFTVSDSNGNTYRPALQLGLTASPLSFAIFYAENIVGGANAVTVTDSVSGPLRFAILEYSGVATSGSLEIAGSTQGASTLPNSGPVTTTSNGDLLLAAIVTTNSAMFSAGSGATIESAVPAEPNTKIIVEDQIQPAAGSASIGASLATSDNWGAGLAAFKAAGGGGGTPAPLITGLNPTSGPVGTSVTVTGQNFGTTVGTRTSVVTFNGTVSRPSSWADTSITVPVPLGATSGNVVVTVGSQSSNGVNFNVVSTNPTITSLNPTSGPVAAVVNISGANFGSTQGNSTVTFNGVSATPTGWSSTAITVPVPSGATSGNVVVTVGGVASNGMNFSVLSTAGAPSLIQHTSVDAGTTASASLAFASSNTQGNWIAVVIRAGGASQVFTVRDSAGNSYLQAAQVSQTTGGVSLAIYYAENIRGGANTVTVSDTASSPLRFAILEYTGIAGGGSLDATSTAQGSSATPSSGNALPALNGDLILGAIGTVGASSVTSGNGFSTEAAVPPAPNTKLFVEDQVQGAAGGVAASGTLTTADNWAAAVAAFKAGSGTPPPPISASLSPTTANVATGYGTQLFTATLQNDVQQRGVTFAVSGSGCSGAACGTFSNVTPTSATYNAPATIPNPASVTVTVTSVADTTKSASAAVTITQGTFTVTLSPKRGAITQGQTQQFNAAVFNDPQNGGVVLAVDGNNGGDSVSGTITPAGLYTPGTKAGVHTVTATSTSNAAISASAIIAVTDLPGVFTHHNDTARTGQNVKEYALTPANVTASTFGALYSCTVDGFVFAAPLYVASLNVGGQIHNVVVIATSHASVYAFDADSPSCAQLWKTSFLGPGVNTVTTRQVGDFSNDMFPEIGITSTPVIDPSTNTVYVEVKTAETVGTGCSNICYIHRLHALNLLTGQEKTGSPVVITAPNFNSLFHHQRPALLLNNGTIYIAFGSHGDGNVYQGWVMAYDATSLAQKFAWSSVPAGVNNRGGIWNGGAGPAVDANGNVYVETGNGVFDGTNNFGDSVVKLSAAGKYLDSFTPFDQATLQQNDIDLGSAGTIILPDSMGSAAHPHLALSTGKIGILFLLDQTNLGQFNAGSNNDVQEVPIAINTTQLDGGIFGQPAYWNGNIYVTEVNEPLNQFLISNGVISTPAFRVSSNTFSLRGGTPVVSASGASDGIVWILDLSAWASNGPAILDAYDATDISHLLFSSPTSGTGVAGNAVKFTIPVVANGRVYVGGQYGFTVFGLFSN